MSDYIITTEQIEELNRAHGGMQILTSWLSAYAIFDTSEFPPQMKSEHLAITLPNIVRCRDCKHAFKADRGLFDCIGPLTTSWDYQHDDYKENLVEPDGFCKWGEKRK